MPLDEQALTDAMNKKRSKGGEKFSIRKKKEDRDHVAALVEQHNSLGTAPENEPQRQALRRAIEALGGKLPRPLPGGATSAEISGMGDPGGPPGDASQVVPATLVPDKHEFTGALGDLIDSRPDLRSQLLEIARVVQMPPAARVQQMKKLIKETPAPETPAVPAPQPEAPAALIPGAPPMPGNARQIPGRPAGFKLKPPTPPSKELRGGNNPERGKVDRPLIP